MEDAIAQKKVNLVCVAIPNILHEEAVMLCYRHKKAVRVTKPLGRNANEAQSCKCESD